MGTRNIESIVARLREQIETVTGIEEAYLLDSLASEDDGPTSDVNVAVYLNDSLPPEGRSALLATLAADLMAALGTNDVELAALNDAPPMLYERVLRAGMRVTARDLRATTTREGYAISRYCDWLPQLEKIERAHRRQTGASAIGENSLGDPET